MEDQSIADPSSKSWVPIAAVLFVFVACSVRIVSMVDSYSVDVLFWDQWDLMVPLMEDVGSWDLFRFQHGPHRQGVAFLSTALIAHWTDWSTRADAFAIALMIVAACALALELTARLRGRLSIGDAAIPLLMLTPAQYGIFIHTPNASHGAAPLLMLLLSARCLLIENVRIRYGLLLLLDFLLIHTGFGIFMGALVPLYFAVDIWRAMRRRRSAFVGDDATVASLSECAIGLALSLVWIAVFLVGYEFDPAVPGFELHLRDFLGHPRYVALMFANLCGLKGTGGIPTAVGSAILLACIVIAVIHLRNLFCDDRNVRSEVILLLIAFGLLFCETTAIGRLALGLPGAQATRYVPLVVPVLLGLLLHFSSLRLARFRNSIEVLTVVALLAATIPMRAPEAQFMARLQDRKSRWVEAYRATHEIRGADRAARMKIYPWPPQRTNLQEKLDFLEARKLNLFRDR